MNRILSRTAAALAICLALLLSACPALASSPSDEILNYEIRADVNEDATVDIHYHIEWKVLDSDELGPLSWVNIGVPNDHLVEVYDLSDNISDYELNRSNGFKLNIFFDDEYYEGEVVSFDFSARFDNMYEMNAVQDGQTLYYFTPGWFDDIAIDKLSIFWNSDKVESISAEALLIDNYYTWSTELAPGEKFSVKVSYPNDAFAFDEGKQFSTAQEDDIYYDDSYSGSYTSGIFGIISLIFPVVFFFSIFAVIKNLADKSFRSESGFASGKTETKLTHTKVVYFDSCPGCGAPRPEGKTVCPYCGRDLVKSEEIIKEEKVNAEDREALKYKKKGEYHYSSDPNTFVRVNVVHVPVIASRPSSGSHRGGCAHSSCACACASCACACACACAGGGRAGCSTKDFYDIKLKLKQIERKR